LSAWLHAHADKCATDPEFEQEQIASFQRRIAKLPPEFFTARPEKL
jgi:hypothetical protein